MRRGGGVQGNGKVYQRRGLWWITFRHESAEYRLSVGRALGVPPRSVTEQDARRLLDGKLEAIYAHRFIEPRQARVTVGECLDDLVADLRRRRKPSAEMLAGMAALLTAEIGHHRAADFTTDAFERLVDHWQDGRKHSPAYINARLAFLRQAMQRACDAGHLPRVPKIPRLEVRNARTQVVTPEAWPAIHSELRGVYADVAEFAWLSAWRKTEILTLPWDALDLPGRKVRLGWTKNGDGRLLPLDAPLWDLIERRHRQRALAPWIFHLFGRPLCGKTVLEQFQAAAGRAGQPGLVFHDLRGSAITNMIDAGVPEFVVMRISGHRSLTTLKRYHRQNVDRMAEALEATRAYVAARQAKAQHADNSRTISVA